MSGAEISINYGEKFRLLRIRLREADKAMRLEFMAGVRAAVNPLKVEVPRSAKDKLPRRGGLAEKVAKSKYGTRTKGYSVMFQAVNPIDIRSIDEGSVRHPVFGQLNSWVEQKVESGFWSDPIHKDEPIVMAKLNEVMNTTIKRIEGV